jgi:hypothetical protein
MRGKRMRGTGMRGKRMRGKGMRGTRIRMRGAQPASCSMTNIPAKETKKRIFIIFEQPM